jgi:SAM-dependent methyltransferase
MCLAAFKGLRLSYPYAELVFFNHKDYADILDRCPDLDRWYHTAGMKERRPRLSPIDENRYPYLRQESGPWAHSIDLWCPAWPHEHDQPGPVTKSRVQLFAEAAGVWEAIRHDPRPRVRITADDKRRAVRFFKEEGLDPAKTIGWQPFPTDTSRKWPEKRVSTCAQILARQGYRSLVFDCTSGRPQSITGGVACACRPLGVVAAIVGMLPLVVCPDSAFMHLCGCDGVDTPCLSLHGKTAGSVAQAPYPLGSWLQGAPVDCDAPCWHRESRGHSLDDCRAKGCTALLNIPVSAVLAAIGRILAGDHVGETVADDGSERVPVLATKQTPDRGPEQDVLRRFAASYMPFLGEALDGRVRGAVLDAGCGSGHQLAQMRAAGWDVTGLDRDAAVLKVACANYPGLRDRFVEADVADLAGAGFGQAAFSVVHAHMLLEHLRPGQAKDVLAQFWRVLEPGGLLFAIYVALGKLVGSDPGHICIRPEAEWEAMAEEVGFRLLYDEKTRIQGMRLFRANQATWALLVAEKPMEAAGQAPADGGEQDEVEPVKEG